MPLLCRISRSDKLKLVEFQRSVGWNARPESEYRFQPSINTQHQAQRAVRHGAPEAKDIHQQSVRTVRAVEFLPPPRTGLRPARRGVDFQEAPRPIRIGADVPLGDGMEISVPVVVIASEDNARNIAGSECVRRAIDGGDLLVSGSQFLPQHTASPH